MSATVLPHAAGVVEALTAHGAQKRRFTCMRPDVHLQVAFHCERFAAVGAGVWPLSAVRSLVRDEMRHLLERFGTHVALVRLFARMDESVSPEAANV